MLKTTHHSLLWLLILFTLAVLTEARADPTAPPEVLTLDEAAMLLRLAPETTRRLVKQGQLPGRQIGAEWRFSRTVLLAWLAGDDNPAGAVYAKFGAPELHDAKQPEIAAIPFDPGEIRGMGASGKPSKPLDEASVPETIGERPKLTTADQMFLRDQQVLMKRGEIGFELSAFYAKSEDRELVLLPPSIDLGRIEDESFLANFTARYGLTSDLQLFGKIGLRDQELKITATDASTGDLIEDTLLSRLEWEDLILGGRWTALREGLTAPEVVLSAETHIPTRDSAFGLGGGIALVKSVDPVALFGNLDYQYRFTRDFDDVTRLQPRHTLTVGGGYAFAVNDRLTLSNSLTGVFSSRTEFSNAILPSRDRFALQFGLTYRLTDALFLEPTVAFDLSGTGSNFSIGLNLPYSMRP